MNLFTPERGSQESRQAYAARRANAKLALQRMTLRGPHAAFGGASTRAQLRSAAVKRKNRRGFADTYLAFLARKRRDTQAYDAALARFKG